MDYSDSTIAVSATVEEQAFSLPRRAVGLAFKCKTNGLQRVCENPKINFADHNILCSPNVVIAICNMKT